MPHFVGVVNFSPKWLKWRGLTDTLLPAGPALFSAQTALPAGPFSSVQQFPRVQTRTVSNPCPTVWNASIGNH